MSLSLKVSQKYNYQLLAIKLNEKIKRSSIQKAIRKEVCLIIDILWYIGKALVTLMSSIQPGFFNNPSGSHNITGISQDLIVRIGLIIKSSYKINSTLFDIYLCFLWCECVVSTSRYQSYRYQVTSSSSSMAM